MSKALFITAMFVLLTLDYSEISTAKFYYWSSRYWYGLSSFAGTKGLNAEKKYFEEMEVHRG